jgi:hypothetical protein
VESVCGVVSSSPMTLFGWSGRGPAVRWMNLVRRSAVASPVLGSRRAPHALSPTQRAGWRCLLVSTVGTDLRPGQIEGGRLGGYGRARYA